MNAGVVDVDVHGMNEWQAQIAVDSALRRAGSGVYRIRVIHGYTHNTVLRDMVHYRYTKNTKVLRVIPGDNPGQTYLILKELY